MLPPINALYAQDKNVSQTFSTEAADPSHPQQTLPVSELSQLYREVLQSSLTEEGEEGGEAYRINFIGYAVNLIHLTPELLVWRCPNPALALPRPSGGDKGRAAGRAGSSAAPPLKQLGLRQTLLTYLFGNAMVFEAAKDLERFRSRCHERRLTVSCRLVSLDGHPDGGGVKGGAAGLLSRRALADPALGWCVVPRQAQLQAPLDARVVKAKVCLSFMAHLSYGRTVLCSTSRLSSRGIVS